MIAGAICEETECSGLILMILAVMLAAALVVIVVAVAWMATVSAILERSGWGRARRRATAAVCVTFVVALLWAVATALPDVGGLLAPSLALASVPVALWQRRVTRRHRSEPLIAQSRPCSTA